MGRLLDLTRAQRIWHGGHAIDRLWAGGTVWTRPGLSLITLTGDPLVSRFFRAGISYTQILFAMSGTMRVSDPVADAQWALIGGGGSGGNSTTGAIWPGGAAAAWPEIGTGVLLPGLHELSIGPGGVGVATTANGNRGSDSLWLHDSLEYLRSLGGGYGGIAQGGDGGTGGGAGSSSATEAFLGGIGHYNGGASYPASLNSARRAGAGAGAGGPGGDGVSGANGAAGPPVQLLWTADQMWICEGAMGGIGAAGVDSTLPGSGSIGRRLGNGSSAGQPGLAVIVYPTANAVIA